MVPVVFVGTEIQNQGFTVQKGQGGKAKIFTKLVKVYSQIYRI